MRKWLVLMILMGLIRLNQTWGAVPPELKQAIDAKLQELNAINTNIKKLNTELKNNEKQQRTLKRDLENLDHNINQLNLNIRSSEINIAKLKLELEALRYEIDDVSGRINLKKATISRLLHEIQQSDRENLLLIMLKNRSLAEVFSTSQNIGNLSSKLAVEIKNLSVLKTDLNAKLAERAAKKEDLELENQNLKNRRDIVSAQKAERARLLAQTKNQEQLYQRQLAELEQKQTEIAGEISKIEEELRSKIDPSLLPAKRPGVLSWPVSGRLTQKFGEMSRLYGGRPHNGIDIGAPIGTSVVAADDGRVLEVWDQDRYCYKGAYGKFIVIEHNNNLTTLYAHLSGQTVQKNTIVRRGEMIGYVGQTGYATGPHLHFAVYASQNFYFGYSKAGCGPVMPYGAPLDPLDYL